MDPMIASVALSATDIHPMIANPNISVVVIDCSATMQQYASSTLAALNRMLETMRSAKAAYRTYVCVIGFGEVATVLAPCSLVMSARPIARLPFSNGTRLYATSCEALTACLSLHEALVRRSRAPSFTVSLITDGLDNASPHASERRCRRLAAESIQRGMDLRLYALGVRAESLATCTGFPRSASYQLVPAPESIAWTLAHIVHS